MFEREREEERESLNEREKKVIEKSVFFFYSGQSCLVKNIQR